MRLVALFVIGVLSAAIWFLEFQSIPDVGKNRRDPISGRGAKKLSGHYQGERPTCDPDSLATIYFTPARM